ncbi:TolC family protein [Pseudomonas sp. P9_35]|uniref:TolC family protein n=1 Tax=unclassified Pseudomonas TaxID=196821 RepID=UPI002A35FCE4|nr:MULTISPECIES: TolC family protein [unclassified Pseudomonas]WPN65639.1 TolC family protein [Pseudomonas sp. P9_32]WPN71390.1 TolC family protein [Pseudomonas sp. P9_35]
MFEFNRCSRSMDCGPKHVLVFFIVLIGVVPTVIAGEWQSTSAVSPVSAKADDARDLGVSALALGRTTGALNRQAGPSEMELRAMFLKAVRAADGRSPDIRMAQAGFQASQADIEEAKGQRWPQVDLGSHSKPIKWGGAREYEDNSTAGVDLSISTSLYDWGRVAKTIDSRKQSAEAARSAIATEREGVAYQVVFNIIELSKQRIIVDVSQRFVDRMEELVGMLAGIVAVDKGRESELTQAKARLLQALSARDSAQTRAGDAEINLRKLVGDGPLLVPRTHEWNLHLPNMDALLAKVDDHPSIRQGHAQVQSAELQAEVVRASSLPQLSWVVSKTTADDSLGRKQPWQTSLAMTWGAFRGGSVRAAERAVLQRGEAARQHTEQQRLDLEYQIRTAEHEARTSLERAELYRNLSMESERIRLAFYQQWYHLGKRTLLDVLIAENDHYSNRVGEVSNRFDGYQAIIRQYAGAGSLVGWLAGSS